MEQIPDSDPENDLPELPISAIDKDLLRDMYLFFTPATRSRLRAEALSSPFAKLYEEIDTESEQPGFEQPESFEQPEIVEPQEREPQHISSQNSLHALSPITHLDEEPHVPIPEHQTQAASTGLSGGARPRSLRKRTFASRHPYIADQADWLGICTIDSINEMFDGDEDITNVVRALNRLYLQKKKRYPDEDRYRSKSFYAHLGKSKLLALQGDQDTLQSDLLQDSQDNDFVGSQEPESQDMPDTQVEEELIPLDIFDLPQNQEPSYAPDNDPESSPNSSANEESESGEEMIRVGGRYRKLSKILRGVLPESAKRLSWFQAGPEKKKPRKVIRELVPRKGLAIRKKGIMSTQSAELAMELQNDFDEDDQMPLPTPDSTLEQSHFAKMPSLQSTYSNMNRFSSPEPQIEVFSGSDSDTESVELIDPRSINMVTPAKSLQHPISSWFQDGDEALEGDEIDNMLASSRRSNGTKKKSIHSSVRRKNPPADPSRVRPYSASRQFNVQGSSRSYSQNRSTKQQPRIVGMRAQSKVNSVRSLDGARKKPVSSKKITSGSRERPIAVSEAKPSSDPKETKAVPEKPKQLQSKLPQPFKRGPVMTTFAYEVESSDRFVHRPTVSHLSHPQNFIPTKEQLLGSGTQVSLGHLFDSKYLDWISSPDLSALTLPQEDSVSFYLRGRHFSFGLFHLEDSIRNTGKFFNVLRKTLSNASTLIDSEMREELSQAIKKLMDWLFISRLRPTDTLWSSVNGILKDFSKLQVREVRKYQFLFHSKMLLVLWVLIGLELRYTKENEQKLYRSLDDFTTDFWITFFQTFSSSDLSDACFAKSEHGLYDSLLIVFKVYEKRPGGWWLPISEALQEAEPLNGKVSNLLDMTYVLAAIIPKAHYNWLPFLSLLARSKDHLTSEFHHAFMDTCDLVSKRLNWPTEEKILIQLYTTFAKRSFENFLDEPNVPQMIESVSSSSHIPVTSAFDRFMVMLYEHISNLSSLKDVKRLISKLLFSSQYHYRKERKNQIMFVNRLNLIVLLSQIPEVDLASQFINLVEQIKDSADAFVYGRSLRALEVVSSSAKTGSKPLPSNAFVILFSAFNEHHARSSEMNSIFSNFINFIGFIFQDTDSNSRCGINEMFRILTKVDLAALPKTQKAELLGILTFVIQQLMSLPELDAVYIETLTRFMKPLLKFLSHQMDYLPVSDPVLDSAYEEIIEMTAQVWYGVSKLTNTHHWNVMMLQKYPYLGNPIARSRFIMFMCLEFIMDGTNDAVLVEIDKVLLDGLISPDATKYSVDLYRSLSHKPASIFHSKRPMMGEVSNLYGLQAYKLQIVTKAIQNVSTSKSMHNGEKAIMLSGFIKRMHEEFTNHSNKKDFTDLCKRVIDSLLRYSRAHVLENEEFWELSVKLGFPNKRVQTKWTNAGDHERVQILNAEFVSSLSYKTDFKNVLDKWIDHKNNHILYALIQVYADATTASEMYWAHLSLLMAYAYEKLRSFQLSVRDLWFSKFLDFLPQIAQNSKIGKDGKYTLYELDALKHCLHILAYSFYVYQGYKDLEYFETVVEQFVNRVYGPRNPSEHTSPFTTHTITTLQSGLTVTFHPQYQHTPEAYTLAYQEYEEQLMGLRQLFQRTPHDSGIALQDYEFSF